jgi:hypothetical protein
VEKDTLFSPVLLAIDEFEFPVMEGMERVNDFEKSYRECCTMCS